LRILGFSKKWGKLNDIEFTTFRFPRKDRDWQVGEVVQIVYKPRSKEREVLGIAEIIAKENELLEHVTQREAIADGFMGWIDMLNWLLKSYPLAKLQEYPMNKLTLRWLNDNL